MKILIELSLSKQWRHCGVWSGSAPFVHVPQKKDARLRWVYLCAPAWEILGILTFKSLIKLTYESLKAGQVFNIQYFSFMSNWNAMLIWVEHEKMWFVQTYFSAGHHGLFQSAHSIGSSHHRPSTCASENAIKAAVWLCQCRYWSRG